MRKESSYIQNLQPLLQKPYFDIQAAERIGVPRHALAYLTNTGILVRITRGVYRSVEYEPQVDLLREQLAAIATTIPNGIICLISALSYYELTEEIPREHWIAVHNSRKAPLRKNTRIIRMRNVILGIDKIKIGEYEVKIFNRERCIIDAFRYLSLEIAIKALKAYFNSPQRPPSIEKLSDYARKLRVNIRPYIMAITT